MAASLPPSVPQAPAQPVIRPERRFDQREWSGAFGDLGTLVPFLFAYVTIAGALGRVEIGFSPPAWPFQGLTWEGERFVTLGTAALSVWNVGVAFVFGLGVLWLVRRGWVKL